MGVVILLAAILTVASAQPAMGPVADPNHPCYNAVATYCAGMTEMAEVMGCLEANAASLSAECAAELANGASAGGGAGEMWTFTVSMVMNEGCNSMMYDETVPLFYHVDEVLERPIGECTTNVLGSSVIFTCAGDFINEHVYIDAAQGAVPAVPDCSGDVMYVMPIGNQCNSYDWGSMLATWSDYCMTPADTTVCPSAMADLLAYAQSLSACVTGASDGCCAALDGVFGSGTALEGCGCNADTVAALTTLGASLQMDLMSILGECDSSFGTTIPYLGADTTANAALSCDAYDFASEPEPEPEPDSLEATASVLSVSALLSMMLGVWMMF